MMMKFLSSFGLSVLAILVIALMLALPNTMVLFGLRTFVSFMQESHGQVTLLVLFGMTSLTIGGLLDVALVAIVWYAVRDSFTQ